MLQRTTRIKIDTTVVAVGLTAFVLGAGAQTATPGFTEPAAGGIYGAYEQKLAYVDAKGNATVATKTCLEYLRGNGTRAGYVLSHGGVVPGSVSVHANARSLTPNVDYYLDPLNGSLYFMEAIRRFDSVTVSYRYVEGQDASRSSVGAPGLALNFGNTSLNLGFGLSSGAGGLDFNTYGFALNSKLSQGGALNGLFYYSTPSENNSNVVGETRASLTPLAKKNMAEAKSDHLISQNLTLHSGAATFRASYQDIGKDFNGFQAMKQSNARNADVMAQIAGMEKEKGIQRLGFGAGLKVAKSDNLSLDWDKIGDSTGDIVRQSLGFQSKQFNLKYSQQSISETFSRFNDLREGEKAQWLKEKGVKRNDLTLGFNAGKGTLLDFSQNSIGDKSGSIAGQSLGFTTKGFQFAWMNRRADSSFTRLGDLSDADKTALALEIRRQFNPNAAATEVTPKDKEQIGLDAGLKRDRLSLAGVLSKQTNFAFNQFGISDGQGEISRRTLNLTGKNFTVSYLDQNISDTYAKLGSMSDFEKSQFANERGIHREALGLNLALSKTSSLSFNQLDLDDKDGSLSRQSLAYQAKGFDFKLNLADTSKGFARAKDLAGTPDPEKAQIESERGFKRMDFAANLSNLKQLKGLTLSTYVYDAQDAADSLDKSIYKHNLIWQMNKATKFSWLADGNSMAKDGATTDGVAHDLITFDQAMARGMKLGFYRDTLTKTVAGIQSPTVTTEFLHFETDRSKTQNLLGETKRIDFGNGKFENTTQFDYNQRLNKMATVHYNKLMIDRGEDPSSDTDLFSWNWQSTKLLNFAGSYARTSNSKDTDVVAKSFSVTGAVNKATNLTGTYTEVNQKGKNVQAISSVAISNAKPAKIGPLKNVTWSFAYAGNNNQKKQVTENAAGKLAAMVGKHQLGVEYGGALAQNGTSAIARAVSFVSDRDAKLPIHVDMMYKARNVNRGGVQLVRKYNGDCKLAKATTINYNYSSLPEDAAGNMQPTKNEGFTLQHAVNKTMTLGVTYTDNEQMAQKTEVSHLGGMLQGKIDPLSAVEVGYTVDVNDQNGSRTDSHTVKLGYDHKIDAEHFLTLSTTYTMYAGSTPDALLTNLEFKTRF